MANVTETIVAAKKLAVVGVSDKKFGGYVYRQLKKKGYQVDAVHPGRENFDGDACYATVADLPSDVKAAVVAVAPETARKVVQEAGSSGLAHLWFLQGNDYSEAVSEAESRGLQTVSKKCILMYAEPVTGIHGFHRFLARLFGKL